MVYPVGIMGGLRSPFASSIRQPQQAPQIRQQPMAQPQPRTEEELRAQYDLMRDNAKRRRAAGDMSQVVLAGEQPFETFLDMQRRGGGLLESKDPITGGLGSIKSEQLPERGMMDILTDYMGQYATPEAMMQAAQSRLMQRDVKPKAERDALMYITQNKGNIDQDRLDFLKYRQSIRPEYGTNAITTADVKPGEISFEEFMEQGKPSSYTGSQPGMISAVGPESPNYDFGDGGTGTQLPAESITYRPFNPNAPIDPGFTPPEFRRPRPGYRPDGFNPNMFQRPMRRPFGFGGRPMMMGMGLGMGLGMGMFGGMNPMMYGIGGANPYGMQPYSNFGRPQFPQYPQPSYGYQQPNPYMRPQPQPSPYSSYYQQPQPNYGMTFRQPSYGGYQQPSGYGNYGQMPNPYTPQQQPSYQQGGSASNGFGSMNTNNYSGYGQQQNYPSFY